MLLAGLLCLVVGITLGLLGGGGSILTVPIFVYAGGFNTREAITLSLIVVFLTSLAGSLRYFAGGWVNRRLVLIFIIFGSVGALVGAKLTPFFSDEKLLLMFGVLMTGIGVLLAFRKERDQDDALLRCRPRFIPSAAISATVGILTGFLGVGGGFLIVPALSIMMKCSMKSAIGTSLVIIAANSLAGLAGRISIEPIEWQSALIFSAVMICGAVLGSRLVEKAPAVLLKKSFAFLILGTGIFVMFQNSRV